MLTLSRSRARPTFALIGAVLAAALATVLVSTDVGVSGATTPASAVDLADTTPRLDTPEVLDGEILVVARAGDRVLLGGNFTQARNAGATVVIDQSNLLAYDSATGLIDTGWTPQLNGEVRAIAVEGDGSTVFVGGEFTTVDGTDRDHLVALWATDGSVDPGFTITTNKKVTALAVSGDRLFVGGTFSTIAGESRRRLAAVEHRTNTVDLSFDVPVDEPTGADGGSSIRRLDVTPDGGTLMSVHNDRTVGGEVRTGVALIDLTGPEATVKPWHTDIYEDNRCGAEQITRVRDGDISPDGSYLVVVSSGDDAPPGCDTAVAFPVAGDGLVEPLWVSRHFDTLESVAITWNAVYVGGHFMFQEAPGSPDPWPGDSNTNYGGGDAVELGADVVAREKLGALHPYDGKALPWPASANGPRGVFDLLAVDGQLLIGHDGDRIDQRKIGRHGSFPIPSRPPGTDPVLPNGIVVEPGGPGYWMIESDGDLYQFGGAGMYDGSPTATVDVATDAIGSGVWILADDGVVTVRGGATWFGDAPLGGLAADEVPSSIAVRPTGDGYWIFTDRGRAFAFGAADWVGDVSHLWLDGPVVASVATPSGGGYWMIGSDGGVFTFGDAAFLGSTGGMRLDAPVVGMAADPDGVGYWLVASDGGVFSFDAPFRGSLPGLLAGQPLQGPIVALVSYGNGYVMLGSDGGAFSFSDLAFLGSLGGAPPNTPVAAIAAFG